MNRITPCVRGSPRMCFPESNVSDIVNTVYHCDIFRNNTLIFLLITLRNCDFLSINRHFLQMAGLVLDMYILHYILHKAGLDNQQQVAKLTVFMNKKYLTEETLIVRDTAKFINIII